MPGGLPSMKDKDTASNRRRPEEVEVAAGRRLKDALGEEPPVAGGGVGARHATRRRASSGGSLSTRRQETAGSMTLKSK
jgi:hypothetical protein